MIIVDNVTKLFGKELVLEHVSFKVKPKTCLGIIGKNGTGKSTLLSMLATALTPTDGTITYDTLNTINDGINIRRKIGVVFQECPLDDDLTVMQNLKVHGLLYGFDNVTLEKNIAEVIKRLQLEPEKKAGVLSGGYRKRLEIARGIMAKPEILLIDEPTLGLDPHAAKAILEHLQQLKKSMTIIMTTNDMREASYLCDDIIMIENKTIKKVKARKTHALTNLFTRKA